VLIDFDTRYRILQAWLELADFRGMTDHLEYYMKMGVLSSPSGLYKLTLRSLYSNPDISEEDAIGVVDSLEKCKNVGMGRALLSLVGDLGPNVVQIIISNPCSIPEVVDRCKDSVFHEELREELERLLQVGVNLGFRDDSIFDELTSGPFTDKQVVLLGELSADHSVVKESLETLGAVVSDGVTKKTDYLLTGEGASGTELDTAVKIGVKIITETDVAEMLGLTI